MKHKIQIFVTFGILLMLSTLLSNKLFSQTSNGIYFQAVARDFYSNPAKDRKIFVQSIVIQTSPTGTKVLTEEHQTTTDANGVFSISIGQGTRINGTVNNLTSIDWSKGPYFLNLKVAISPIAPIINWDYTKDWVDLGTTSFGAVPYALYAGTAAGVDQKVNITDTLKMLATYAKVTTVKSLETSLETKLTAADTIAMLAPYAKTSFTIDSAYFKAQLANYLSLKDTAKILANYLAALNALSVAKLNTSDTTWLSSRINKKMDTADIKSGLALKANLFSPTFTGIVSGVTKAMVGLSNVDNTTDALKPVSTAVQVALNLKESMANKSTVTTLGTSDDLYPTQKAVKTYVDARTTSSSISIGTIGTSNVNGASITSGVLKLAPADETNGGIVTTSAQTFAGSKSFNSNVKINGVTVGRGAGNNDESVAIGPDAMGSSNINGKRNTAIGYGAMRSYIGTSWDNNTSIGYYNLPKLTIGSGNTSVGAESMMELATGVQNTSLGNQSLISTNGNENVGIGTRAGQTITTGSQNTIIGTNADVSTNSLNNASALGYGARVSVSNTIQLGNTSVTNVKTSGTITSGAITYPNTAGANGYYLKSDGSGTASWAALSSGISSVGAIGSSNANGAIISSGVLSLTPADAINGGIVTTSAQTFAGLKTFNSDLTVNGLTIGLGLGQRSTNTALGAAALSKNTSGINNTATGISSLQNNTSGQYNTANGASALSSNIDGSYNTSIGARSLVVNTGGSGNVAIGQATMYSNLTGNNNTAIGVNALNANTIGSQNTAIGYEADVASNNLSNATAIGNGAKVSASNTIQLGNNDVTDVKTVANIVSSRDIKGASYNGVELGLGGGNRIDNIKLGAGALQSNTLSGIRNTATGVNALGANIDGSYNTANGYAALGQNTSGTGNVASGLQTMSSNTTGNFNTAMGVNTLNTNTTGSHNTAIGNEADVASNNLTNATALGYGARVSANNTIQLGNTSVTNVKTSGKLTSGTVTYPNTDGTANQVLTTNGSGVISFGSIISNAGALTGMTLASNVVNSSLTSVGIIANLTTGAIINSGKVVIGASSAANSSAVLEVSSTTQGFLPPRMNYQQRQTITKPANGLVVFCTNCGDRSIGGELEVYSRGMWRNMMGGTAATPPAPLNIGDNFEGGKVAYILQPNDPGYDIDVQHGLIAAPTDISSNGVRSALPWGCLSDPPQQNDIPILPGVFGSAIGTGEQNTNIIVSNCSQENIAAKLCLDYTNGGYSDWFLPSSDELEKLHTNRTIIGGFEDFLWYWSSTQIGGGAHAHWFGPNAAGPIDKYDLRAVRPIRYF